MSKSVRIPQRSYEQADELRATGYESLTNVMAVAIDRLYQAERPKETTMYTTDDWLDAKAEAARRGKPIWRHADGTYAVADADEFADHLDPDGWIEIEGGPMQIRVTYTAGSLDTTGALTDEHIASYADSLKTALEAAFPGADIEVVQGDDDQIRVYAESYDATMETQEAVNRAIEDHYQEWAEEIAALL